MSENKDIFVDKEDIEKEPIVTDKENCCEDEEKIAVESESLHEGVPTDEENPMDNEGSDEEIDYKLLNGNIMKYVYDMMKGEISASLVNEIINTLKCAYEKGYRHSYYEISNAIYQNINNPDILVNPLDSLANNIQIVTDEALDTYVDRPDICKGFRKFYDHIMLEITRINDHSSSMEKINQLIEEFDSESKNTITESRRSLRRMIVRNTERLSDMMERKVTNVTDEIEKLKDNIFSQLVAILGIFASVIIVFFGGASVFAKVLEKLGDIDWIETAPVLSITGFVMFNVIFMFLFVISRMIEKDIGVKIENESWWSKGTIRRWIARYPYMFVFNMLMAIIFFASVVPEYSVDKDIVLDSEYVLESETEGIIDE